jgi:hypothetical protein
MIMITMMAIHSLERFIKASVQMLREIHIMDTFRVQAMEAQHGLLIPLVLIQPRERQ